jgi:hypothetical protein
VLYVTSQKDSSRTTCAFKEGIKTEEKKEEQNYLTGGFVDITLYLVSPISVSPISGPI